MDGSSTARSRPDSSTPERRLPTRCSSPGGSHARKASPTRRTRLIGPARTPSLPTPPLAAPTSRWHGTVLGPRIGADQPDQETSLTSMLRVGRFSRQFEEATNKCTNRSLTTPRIISRFFNIANGMRVEAKRREVLGLREEEAANCAVAENEPAVLAVGDNTIEMVARSSSQSSLPALRSSGTSRIRSVSQRASTCASFSTVRTTHRIAKRRRLTWNRSRPR